jgi:hypothetical protein
MQTETLVADLEDAGLTVIHKKELAGGIDIVCEGTEIWEQYAPETTYEYTLDDEYLTGESSLMRLIWHA